jgi:hypothetical protein
LKSWTKGNLLKKLYQGNLANARPIMPGSFLDVIHVLRAYVGNPHQLIRPLEQLGVPAALVPVANLIRLADDRESGDVVA